MKLETYLVALALIYAAAVNIRTIVDTDLGWQMATGRYIAQQHHIPDKDVFSYTAPGREWVYPPLGGVLFYLVWLAGGFAAITWLGVTASVGTVALLLRRASAATAALAMIAVPLIGYRTLPRANLFTTVLFAAVFVLAWDRYERGTHSLTVAPLLLLLWVNLHTGFIAGLAVIAMYLVLTRRVSWPLLLAFPATLINPWGPRIYSAIWRQEQVQSLHSRFIPEWSRVHLADIGQALDWRTPQSAYWWLVLIAGAAAIFALWKRRLGPAVVLVAAIVASAYAVRFQALFAIVVVVVAGSVLRNLRNLRFLVLPLALLAAIRIYDLASNRYYHSHGEISVFGTGLSSWFPEGAASFISNEHLPGRIWNSYNLGGYLTWRLPQYPDYIDGRAIPFGPEMFIRSSLLAELPPGAPEWKREATAWGINTLIFSVARHGGSAATLRDFCESTDWRPVYLDQVSAVFVRNVSENAAWKSIDCSTVQFEPRGDPYNFYMDSASVLFALGRNAEALAALDNAQHVFAGDPDLYLTRGAVLQAFHRDREAEVQFHTALALGDDPQARFAIGTLMAAAGDYNDAVHWIGPAAREARSWEMYRVLGEALLAAKQADAALRAFDTAAELSPYQGDAAVLGAGFRVQLAVGRAHAWFAKGALARATAYQQEAILITPRNPARWMELAELYDAQGLTEKAADARQHARNLGVATPKGW